MKSLIALGLAACVAAPALAQPSVGVSIGINQPGVYGRIDIGNAPPPPAAIYYPQPVIIAPTPVATYQRPIYLYVPQGYQANWGRYCGRYNACGQPVYFVRDQWVREHYHRPPPPPRPRYAGPPGHHPDGPPGHRRGRDDDRRGHGGDRDKHDKHDKHDKR